MTWSAVSTPSVSCDRISSAIRSAVPSCRPSGAAFAVSSVVNVDQSLQLGGFKEQLTSVEGQLRDPAAFPLVIQALFEQMAGEKIAPAEMARVNGSVGPIRTWCSACGI